MSINRVIYCDSQLSIMTGRGIRRRINNAKIGAILKRIAFVSCDRCAREETDEGRTRSSLPLPPEYYFDSIAMEPGPSPLSIPESAPELPLPKTYFSSIEYPGYVGPSSVPKVLETLGGQASVNTAFKRNANKQDALLELNFRPGNPFSHPVPGDIVPTNNIVLKVVKRKRKRPNVAQGGEDVLDSGIIGEYTTEAIGVISKTARFRSE